MLLNRLLEYVRGRSSEVERQPEKLGVGGSTPSVPTLSALDRRRFLKALAIGGAAVVAHELDLDRLLWEPGKKVTFDLWTPPSYLEVTCDPTALTHFQRQYLEPAVQQMADDIDRGIAESFKVGDRLVIDVPRINRFTRRANGTEPREFVVVGDARGDISLAIKHFDIRPPIHWSRS